MLVFGTEQKSLLQPLLTRGAAVLTRGAVQRRTAADDIRPRSGEFALCSGRLFCDESHESHPRWCCSVFPIYSEFDQTNGVKRRQNRTPPNGVKPNGVKRRQSRTPSNGVKPNGVKLRQNRTPPNRVKPSHAETQVIPFAFQNRVAPAAGTDTPRLTYRDTTAR